MTSFGIEWDTNLTVCDMLEIDAGPVDANLTNRGPSSYSLGLWVEVSGTRHGLRQ